MARPDPRSARLLGLWTAGWLAVFLVSGLLWLGDLSLQWPVLAVPLLWALVAARPRRDRRRPGRGYADEHADGYADGYAEDDWEPIPPPHRSPWRPPAPGQRTDTVERPALRNPHRDHRY